MLRVILLRADCDQQINHKITRMLSSQNYYWDVQALRMVEFGYSIR